MQDFRGFSEAEAAMFAAGWLAAWSGTDVECLLSFYADEAFYSDPVVPMGLQGKQALRPHFSKLLLHNAGWLWSQRRAVPMASGFVNYWRARIPANRGAALDIDGVCLVEVRDGVIQRNEVFFDRTPFAARSRPGTLGKESATVER